MPELELISAVEVVEDAADCGLHRGQAGTIVERPAPELYEV